MKCEEQEIQRSDQWAERLLMWYEKVKRDLPWRRTSDPYSIWVSEVMLQQTQVKTVIPYYHSFLERFPDLSTLAEAPLEDVLELWRGLGYYSRARRLWEGARYVLEEHERRVPGEYQALLRIPGVGEYTAGAIASIAFGECVPVLDGNVKRVAARFLAWEEGVESVRTKRSFMNHLKKWQPAERAGDFNQAMMELGATVCTPKSPQCFVCPLQEGCCGYALGTPQAFPVKRSTERITEAIRPTLVILNKGKVFLKKRPSTGLLANLWEFPGEELLLDPQSVGIKSVKSIGEVMTAAERVSTYSTPSIEELGEKTKYDFPWFDLYQKHVDNRSNNRSVEEKLNQEVSVQGPLIHTFSHRRWWIYWIVLNLSEVDYEAEQVNGLRWVEEHEMDTIALPVAFQKVWEKART